jgi:hypothetical protein
MISIAKDWEKMNNGRCTTSRDLTAVERAKNE